MTLSANQLSAITAELADVNIHTVANPGGEIRGQVVLDATAERKVDLLFQHDNNDLAIWLMDGINRRDALPLSPPRPGDTWEVVAP